MNIQANYLRAEPLPPADQLRLKVASISWELAAAMSAAQEVTDRRTAPIETARKRLGFARRLWPSLIALGPDQATLDRLADDGRVAAAAVAEAEARVALVLAARSAAKAAREAERIRKAKVARARLMTGMGTRAAARFVASQLVARGLVAEEVEGVRALVREVAPTPPWETSPEEILAAWLRLDPP